MSQSSDSSDRLAELGYEQGLSRRLKTWEVVALAMADVSPTMAVLLLTAGVFFVGGTFAVGANLLVAVAVLMIALCLGELASIYPLAGGMYSLARFILPGPMVWITMFNFILQGIIIPASTVLGIGLFLKDLWPDLAISNEVIALIALAAVTGLTLIRIEIGAYVTAAVVVVEVVVLGIISLAAIAHPVQSLGDVVFNPVKLADGALVTVTLGVMLATIAPAFNVINGYDAALGFSEELIGGERRIGRAVLLSAVLASVLILIPLIAAVVAAPDLTAFLSAPIPIVYSVNASLGSGAKAIVDIGVSIALFNATLSLFLYFSRALYATGRDQMWPAPISSKLMELNRFKSPGWAVVVLAVPAAALVFLSALNWLIIFAGTIIAATYFCIAIAALVSRVGKPDLERPFRMPAWPIPPLIVIGFIGVALVTQETQYLVGEAVLIVLALAFWAGSRVWSPTSRGVAGATGPVDHSG